MNDGQTTVAELRSLLRKFVDERDWQQFHAPKNLCMGLAIEVAELMEHFQWISVETSRAVASDPEKMSHVRDEVADVLGYVLALANELEIDLSSAVEQKMVKNAVKYPADEIRGRYGHDDPKR